MTVGLWTDSVSRHALVWEGVLLCSQFSAFTEGCCHITQSSFFAQIVKFGHLERNSVYHALIMHIIEHCSDTIQYTVLNLAQLGLPFFLLSFAQANHLFLAKALREVSQCSSAGCAARDTCVPSALGWTCKKVSKKPEHLFLLSSGAWSDLVNKRMWAPSVDGYTLPFMSTVPQIYYKAQCQLFFTSLLRTGLYNQSNIQFKKLLLHVLIILCLFFMANLWKALIATHFSVRLAFFQEFCYSSVSLAWQTRDFSPLGNKTNVFQEGSRWVLPT